MNRATALSLLVLAAGCDNFYADRAKAVDCAGRTIASNGDVDGKYQATPTHPGPVETENGYLEEFSLSYQGDIDEVLDADDVEELIEGSSARDNDITGFAFRPNDVDVDDKKGSWNTDYVWPVKLYVEMPDVDLVDDSLELSDWFGSGNLYAHAKTNEDTFWIREGGVQIDMVLTEDCHELIPAANGETEHPLN